MRLAARTIAARGVQLSGTAHGQTLAHLMANPTLSDLVGGIESVTLSDEEARRRGTQKTVLERRAPPTFDILIEIQDRHRLLAHPDVGQAVDSVLRGKPPMAELRYYDGGEIRIEKVRVTRAETMTESQASRSPQRQFAQAARTEHGAPAAPAQLTEPASNIGQAESNADTELPTRLRGKTMQLYAFGIPRNRLAQSVRQLGVPAEIVDSLEDADVLITAKAYYRQRPKIISEAEHLNIPIYVLRSNSLTQMENCLADLFSLSAAESTPYEDAIEESESAVRRVLAGERMVDLAPQNAFIRRQQHEMARTANLVSHSYGKEPYRRVRIFRD